CYSIEAPEIDLPNAPRDAERPELAAETLAETWDEVHIRARLEPLVSLYRAWIERQRNSADRLPEPDRVLALSNLSTCSTAANRMQDGIDLLVRDDDARLAFCFANKAIDLQSRWACGRGEPLSWRPFQLAFILLCL